MYFKDTDKLNGRQWFRKQKEQEYQVDNYMPGSYTMPSRDTVAGKVKKDGNNKDFKLTKYARDINRWITNADYIKGFYRFNPLPMGQRNKGKICQLQYKLKTIHEFEYVPSAFHVIELIMKHQKKQ